MVQAINIKLDDEAATLRLAGVLAGQVVAGDLLALRGDLGVGKTALVRGLIQHLTDFVQIVPSPTFTLVQPYDTRRGALLHADLYRLGASEEVLQLGLVEALADHICCVEWPENAGDFLPEPTFDIALELAANGQRTARITATAERTAPLAKALARADALDKFIAQSGWAAAVRVPLAGDASTRRYERLQLENTTAVLMDWEAAPDGEATPDGQATPNGEPIYDGQSYSQIAHLAEAAPAYCRVSRWLAAHDIAVPHLLAADEAAGFILLEDCGDETLATQNASTRAVIYFEAINILLALHQHQAAEFLPLYDGAVQAVEAQLFTEWFLVWRGINIDAAARLAWQDLWHRLGDDLMPKNPVTVLRDFHSPNLLWRAVRQGRYRLVAIDVQDALAGSPAYDMASLIYDARLDVPPAQQQAMLTHYMKARFAGDKKAATKFAGDVELAAAQRNFKIAGIFCRLAMRDNKPAYLCHLPRLCRTLKQNLNHKTLAPVRAWLATHAPEALELDNAS